MGLPNAQISSNLGADPEEISAAPVDPSERSKGSAPGVAARRQLSPASKIQADQNQLHQVELQEDAQGMETGVGASEEELRRMAERARYTAHQKRAAKEDMHRQQAKVATEQFVTGVAAGFLANSESPDIRAQNLAQSKQLAEEMGGGPAREDDDAVVEASGSGGKDSKGGRPLPDPVKSGGEVGPSVPHEEPEGHVDVEARTGRPTPDPILAGQGGPSGQREGPDDEVSK